jgi:hypothetical protein
MPIFDFMAFYPSRPFWAGSKVNFDDQSYDGWFYNQMVEEVFSQSNDTYTIKICRDGQIMLRIEALEQDQSPEAHPRIEDIVQRWGEYLDYLNAFYLLFDSSTLEVSNLCYFNLHEITNRDAFRVGYKDGKMTKGGIADESITSVLQMAKYASSYPAGVPIQHDPLIGKRQVVTLDVIEHASSLFARVVASPGLEKTLASFAKSLSEYKVGNYETSVVLSWFITEAAIKHFWKTHIDSLNYDLQGGRKRVNSDRMAYLTKGGTSRSASFPTCSNSGMCCPTRCFET